MENTQRCRCGERIVEFDLCGECLILHPLGTDEPWESDHARYVTMISEYLTSWSPPPLEDSTYSAIGINLEKTLENGRREIL